MPFATLYSTIWEFATNPFLKRLVDDARMRETVDRSRARYQLLLDAIRKARAAGRFPRYLEQPLQDLQSTLKDAH